MSGDHVAAVGWSRQRAHVELSFPLHSMNAIRTVVSAALAGVKAIIRPTDSVIADTDDRMLLRVDGRLVAFDRAAETVRVGAETPVKFKSFESVEIVHRLNSDEAPEAWLIELQGAGLKPILVGVDRDPTEASIIGARVSTIMGVKVVVARVPR